MKTLVNRIVMVAASAVLLGTAAYGQVALKANVPFAFRAGRTTMPAGNYSLIRHNISAGSVIQLRNDDVRRSVVMLTTPVDSHDIGSDLLLFGCVDKDCSLRQIRTPDGSVNCPRPRVRIHEAVARMILIPLGTKPGV